MCIFSVLHGGRWVSQDSVAQEITVLGLVLVLHRFWTVLVCCCLPSFPPEVGGRICHFGSSVPWILLYTDCHSPERLPNESQHYKLTGHNDMLLLYQQGLDLPVIICMWAPCLQGTRAAGSGAALASQHHQHHHHDMNSYNCAAHVCLHLAEQIT